MEIKNGYLTDLHVHSVFSYDCEETTENYIRKAIERGDERIGFVQHYDYDCFLNGEKLRFAIWMRIKTKLTG